MLQGNLHGFLEHKHFMLPCIAPFSKNGEENEVNLISPRELKIMQKTPTTPKQN